MAAQAGRAMAVLFRSTAAERHASPSHLRVVLARAGHALEVRIPKRRGPPLVQPLHVALPRPWDRKASLSAPALAANDPITALDSSARPAFHLVGR
jgi:hypothetical protein